MKPLRLGSPGAVERLVDLRLDLPGEVVEALLEALIEASKLRSTTLSVVSSTGLTMNKYEAARIATVVTP